VTPRYAELRWEGLSRGSLLFLRARFSFGFPVVTLTLTPLAAVLGSSSVPAFLRGLAMRRGAEASSSSGVHSGDRVARRGALGGF
jgi:hypothetical protein